MGNAGEITWEQSISAINELITRYRAILDSYNRGEIAEPELHQKAMPIVIALLQNFDVQASFAQAFIEIQEREIDELKNSVKLYEKFIRKMGLQYKFDDFCGKRKGKKLKNMFHRYKL